MSMRRILAAGLLAMSLSVPAYAADSAAGGLEFSGNTSILSGWQQDDGSALPGPGGEFALERGLRAPNRTTFNFYLDQFEVDLEKSFGEKVRLRADLDFGRALSGSVRSTEGSNFIVEQAYVALGLLGGELSVGRFNTPVGYYVVDRAFNPTISYSNIYNFLTPTNVTGAKLYWAFNESMDLQVYLMNQMFDCLYLGGSCLQGPLTAPAGSVTAGGIVSSGVADSAVPSWGMRLGYNFGEDKTASTVGISYLGGPEQGTNDHLDHMFDLDFSIKLTEELLMAGEGIYYQRNNLPGITGPNGKFAGGLLVLDWQASEVWDLFFSFGYVNDFQGVVTGIDQQVYNWVAGFGYQITDGAKFKMEYRADLFDYAKTQPTRPTSRFPGLVIGDTTSWSNAVAGEFAYVF